MLVSHVCADGLFGGFLPLLFLLVFLIMSPMQVPEVSAFLDKALLLLRDAAMY